MKPGSAAVGVLVLVLALSGCASLPLSQPASQPTPTVSLPSDDDDWSHVIAQLRSDLNRFNSREVARKPTIAPQTSTTQQRNKEFSDRANALFTPLSGSTWR